MSTFSGIRMMSAGPWPRRVSGGWIVMESEMSYGFAEGSFMEVEWPFVWPFVVVVVPLVDMMFYVPFDEAIFQSIQVAWSVVNFRCFMFLIITLD